MSTIGMIQVLYIALALVMMGLGLSLKTSDFMQLRRQKLAVTMAIVIQMIALPLVALALASLFDVAPPMAVGLVLLAATPGSISANLYSHLFGGSVAFNIALTAVNTALCAFTLPVVCAAALQHFVASERLIPTLYDSTFTTMAIVVVPVLLGMLLGSARPVLAQRLSGPIKTLSAVAVVGFSLAAIAKEWTLFSDGFARVGVCVIAFNVLSLLLSYSAGRLARVGRAECTSMGFQACVHNAIQAIYIAVVVLGETAFALPAAINSVTMNLVALGFGILLSMSRRRIPSVASTISMRPEGAPP